MNQKTPEISESDTQDKKLDSATSVGQNYWASSDFCGNTSLLRLPFAAIHLHNRAKAVFGTFIRCCDIITESLPSGASSHHHMQSGIISVLVALMMMRFLMMCCLCESSGNLSSGPPSTENHSEGADNTNVFSGGFRRRRLSPRGMFVIQSYRTTSKFSQNSSTTYDCSPAFIPNFEYAAAA